MAKKEIVISFKWWFLPYINTLTFFCELFGVMPDKEKLGRVVKSAMLVNGKQRKAKQWLK